MQHYIGQIIIWVKMAELFEKDISKSWSKPVIAKNTGSIVCA